MPRPSQKKGFFRREYCCIAVMVSQAWIDTSSQAVLTCMGVQFCCSCRELWMLSQKYLRSVYGPAAAFSEHQPGDVISYLEQGREKSGMILWVCAPSTLGDRYIGMTYVVQSRGSGRPELVSPANVLALCEEAP